MGVFMGYIHCCGALHKTKSFVIVPQQGFVLCELDVLNKCPVCNHYVVQFTRIDEANNLSIMRYKNEKAKSFLEKMKSKILYEDKFYDYSKYPRGNNYLCYNEFGVKKRCYSNLSNLKIGKI